MGSAIGRIARVRVDAGQKTGHRQEMGASVPPLLRRVLAGMLAGLTGDEGGKTTDAAWIRPDQTRPDQGGPARHRCWRCSGNMVGGFAVVIVVAGEGGGCNSTLLA